MKIEMLKLRKSDVRFQIRISFNIIPVSEIIFWLVCHFKKGYLSPMLENDFQQKPQYEKCQSIFIQD